jgi:small nuclear ribonucleoprotein (snRNP)-like protein
MSQSPSLLTLDSLVGHPVVLDVASQYVYVGTLVGYEDRYLVLEDADVHDLRDSGTTREQYVVGARRHGVPVNRRRVLVRTGEVVSLSALADVVE